MSRTLDRNISPQSEAVSLRALRVPLALVLSLAGLYVISIHNYLLFHGIIELATIAVATTLFLIAWHARRIHQESAILFLGTAYLAVGLLDLVHTLAYHGMGVFPHHDPNLPTQLWIAARYLQAVSVLILPLAIRRTFRPERLLAGYALAVAIVLVAVFQGVFPDAFLPESGLTPFKIYSEYAISALFLGATALLYRHRQALHPRMVPNLMASFGIAVVGELLFTQYVSVYGVANQLGHFAKLISFFFLYRAVIVVGLEQPYAVLFRSLQDRELAQKRSEARLRAVLDVLPVGVQIADASGEVVEANRAAARTWSGYGEGLPDDARALIRRAAHGGEHVHGEELVATAPDGSRRSLIAHAVPIRDARGRIDGAVAAQVDVTELKHTQAALGEERDNLTAILDAMPDMIYIVNELFEVEYTNPTMLRELGSVPMDAKCYAYQHGRDEPCPWCPNDRVMAGETVRWQWTSPHNGRTYDVIDTPVRRPGTRVSKLKIMRDITELREASDLLEERVRERTAELEEANRALKSEIQERARAEAALRMSEERFRVAIGSTAITMATCDRDLHYTWIYNPHPDFDPLGVLGKRDDELAADQGVAALVALKQRVLEAGSGQRAELTFQRSDGERIYDMVAEPLRDESGQIVGVTTAALDITERREAEQNLARAEQLTLTGKVAAMFAHEIKNPLQAVVGCLGLAREVLAEDGATADSPEAHRYLQVASEELYRASDLLSQLRDLHVPHPDGNREPTDVNALVEHVLTLNEKLAADHGVALELELADDLPPVPAARGQLQQVFLNMVLNALDAMPHGGRLIASTCVAGTQVRVSFADSGVGIPPHVLKRLFRDFQSTKRDGLGLGLVISDSIVRDHGGFISVDTEEGRGTIFTIHLPVTEETPDPDPGG